MSLRAAAATLLAALAGATPAAAALAPGARLSGTFSMRGRITQASGVRGEHRGERIRRDWRFVPLCAEGACARVRLLRQRGRGRDRLVLRRDRAHHYFGRGHFYAPLRCAGHLDPRGELVRFTVAVQITATERTAGGVFADRIRARYSDVERRNLTRCVFVGGHDAARYRGRLSLPAQ